MLAFYAKPRAVVAPKTFVVLVVEPIGDFSPNTFQYRPERFRVINRLTFTSLGKADTKRFLFNDRAKRLGSFDRRWAITG